VETKKKMPRQNFVRKKPFASGRQNVSKTHKPLRTDLSDLLPKYKDDLKKKKQKKSAEKTRANSPADAPRNKQSENQEEPQPKRPIVPHTSSCDEPTVSTKHAKPQRPQQAPSKKNPRLRKLAPRPKTSNTVAKSTPSVWPPKIQFPESFNRKKYISQMKKQQLRQKRRQKRSQALANAPNCHVCGVYSSIPPIDISHTAQIPTNTLTYLGGGMWSTESARSNKSHKQLAPLGVFQSPLEQRSGSEVRPGLGLTRIAAGVSQTAR
jgi:hypothetical protein